jgi:hypothetical protein
MKTGVRARGDDGAQQMNPAAAQKGGRRRGAGHDGRDVRGDGVEKGARCCDALGRRTYRAGAKRPAESGGGAEDGGGDGYGGEGDIKDNRAMNGGCAMGMEMAEGQMDWEEKEV